MKIRWTHDSIRLRITPPELDALQNGNSLTERLAIPGGEWRVVLAPDAPTTELSMTGASMRVALALKDVRALAEAEREGVYFLCASSGVRYYVEKDFPCAHPRAIEAHEPVTPTFAPPPDFEERKRETS